jgi:hypothetical protein
MHLKELQQLIDFLQRRAFRPRSSELRYVRLLTVEKSSCVRFLLARTFLSAWPKAMLSSIFRSHKRNDEALSSPIGLQSIVFILGVPCLLPIRVPK